MLVRKGVRAIDVVAEDQALAASVAERILARRSVLRLARRTFDRVLRPNDPNGRIILAYRPSS
jgi:hypothetical protein